MRLLLRPHLTDLSPKQFQHKIACKDRVEREKIDLNGFGNQCKVGRWLQTSDSSAFLAIASAFVS